MRKLEDLKAGSSLVGVEPTGIVSVVSVVAVVAAVPIADGAVTLIYKTSDGVLRERRLNRHHEKGICEAVEECPRSFDGDAAAFQFV